MLRYLIHIMSNQILIMRMLQAVLHDTLNIQAANYIKLTSWIPVTERLPKTEDGYAYILVCMDDEFVATTDYTEKEGFSLWADSGEVLAWMPLPEPYKA